MTVGVFGMFVAENSFLHSDNGCEYRLCFSVLALAVVNRRQIVQGAKHSRMLLAEPTAADVDHLDQKRSAFAELARVAMQLGQIHHADERFEILLAAHACFGVEHLREHGLGLRVFALFVRSSSRLAMTISVSGCNSPSTRCRIDVVVLSTSSACQSTCPVLDKAGRGCCCWSASLDAQRPALGAGGRGCWCSVVRLHRAGPVRDTHCQSSFQ